VGGLVVTDQAIARVKRSPKRTANWALAMHHSRAGMVHSFSDRFNTRNNSFSAASSVGKWPRARTARRSLAFSASMAAHAALVQGHAEQLGDPALDVRAAPPDDLVLGQGRPVSSPRLRPPAPLTAAAWHRRHAGSPDLRHAVCVGAVDPITQRLPVHPSQPRRVRPLAPVHDQSQRQ